MLDLIIPVSQYDPDHTSLSARMRALDLMIPVYRSMGAHVILIEQITKDQYPYFDSIAHKYMTVYDIITYPQFSKGWCINHGFSLSDNEYVCIAESDMYIPHDSYFYTVMTSMKDHGQKWCIGWNRLLYTTITGRDLVIKTKGSKSETFYHEHNESNWRHPQAGGTEGGYVFFTREFYNDIGGFCEGILGLGGIDNEICSRARYASGMYPHFNKQVFHLWHHRSKGKHIRVPGMESNNNIVKLSGQYPGSMIQYLRTLKQGYIECPNTIPENFLLYRLTNEKTQEIQS